MKNYDIRKAGFLGVALSFLLKIQGLDAIWEVRRSLGECDGSMRAPQLGAMRGWI